MQPPGLQERGPAQPRPDAWASELPEASGQEEGDAVDLAFPGLVAALGPGKEDTICVCFSGAGFRLVSGGMDEQACVWDPFQDQALALEKVHTDTIVALAMGRRLGPLDAATTAAELRAGSAEATEAAEGADAVPGPASPTSDPLNGILHRQPALIYTAGLDGQICALNTYNYTLTACASVGSPIEWMDLHGAADYVLVGTSDGVAYLYDFSKAAKEAADKAGEAVRASLQANGGVNPPPEPQGPSEATMVSAYCGHDGTVSAGLFTHTHKYVATGCTDGTVRLFRALGGECVGKVELHSEVSSMALVPPDPQDRKRRNGTILVGLESGELSALTVSGEKLLQVGRYQHHQKRIEKILICQHRYVVLGSLDGTLSILDARSNYGVRSVVDLGEPITALCYANWGSEPREDGTDAPGPTSQGAFGKVVSLPVLLAGTSAGSVYAIRLLDGRVLYGFNVFAPNRRFGRSPDKPVLDISWARPRGFSELDRCGYMAVAGDANVYVWNCDPDAYVDSFGAGARQDNGTAPPDPLGQTEDSKDGADGIDGGELDY